MKKNKIIFIICMFFIGNIFVNADSLYIKVEPGTNKMEILSNNFDEYTGGDYAKTGDTVKVDDKDATVIVYGDLNKDGKVSLDDINLVGNYLTDKNKSTIDSDSIMHEAADCVGLNSDKIELNDFAKMVRNSNYNSVVSRIHFVNLDNGESIFIESKDKYILINPYSGILEYLEKLNISSLDYVIVTDPRIDNNINVSSISKYIDSNTKLLYKNSSSINDINNKVDISNIKSLPNGISFNQYDKGILDSISFNLGDYNIYLYNIYDTNTSMVTLIERKGYKVLIPNDINYDIESNLSPLLGNIDLVRASNLSASTNSYDLYGNILAKDVLINSSNLSNFTVPYVYLRENNTNIYNISDNKDALVITIGDKGEGFYNYDDSNNYKVNTNNNMSINDGSYKWMYSGKEVDVNISSSKFVSCNNNTNYCFDSNGLHSPSSSSVTSSTTSETSSTTSTTTSSTTSGTSSGVAKSITCNTLAENTTAIYCQPFNNNIAYMLLGKYNTTPECSGNIYHDIIAHPGTPVYAGIDGTATFVQATTDGVIRSYGNFVVIQGTNKEGRTVYMYYAHLDDFYINDESKKTGNAQIPNSMSCSKIQVSVNGTTYDSCSQQPCSGYSTANVIAQNVSVKAGDLIGYVGSTGNAPIPHLHIEIHMDSYSGSCYSAGFGEDYAFEYFGYSKSSFGKLSTSEYFNRTTVGNYTIYQDTIDGKFTCALEN